MNAAATLKWLSQVQRWWAKLWCGGSWESSSTLMTHMFFVEVFSKTVPVFYKTAQETKLIRGRCILWFHAETNETSGRSSRLLNFWDTLSKRVWTPGFCENKAHQVFTLKAPPTFIWQTCFREARRPRTHRASWKHPVLWQDRVLRSSETVKSTPAHSVPHPRTFCALFSWFDRGCCEERGSERHLFLRWTRRDCSQLSCLSLSGAGNIHHRLLFWQPCKRERTRRWLFPGGDLINCLSNMTHVFTEKNKSAWSAMSRQNWTDDVRESNRFHNCGSISFN